MNIMPDGTGFILPPRCAARHTLRVLWKYGIQHIAYHNIDVTQNPKKVVMLIRNPATRLLSWLRLWNSTLTVDIDACTYIANLHEPVHGVQFVDQISQPNSVDYPWKYPIPLSNYLRVLESYGLPQPTHYVRVENYEEDMEACGFPVRDVERTHNWEPNTEGISDKKFLKKNSYFNKVIQTYYESDYANFGYAIDA